MPSLHRPTTTVTNVVTKEGECSVNIALEITIKLDGDGIVLAAGAQTAEQKKQQEEDDKVNFAIPDVSSQKKLKFGKNTKE